jgi:hypothetical protein
LRLEPGTYYARIEAYPINKRNYQALTDELNYTLLIGNTFEDESNDGLTEANYLGTIEKPVMIAGKTDPENDLDFFKFDVPDKCIGRLERSVVTTSLLNDYIDTIVYSFNESLNRYIPETSSMTNYIEISYSQIIIPEAPSSEIFGPGSYFVRLQKSNDADQDLKDYILLINLSQMEIKSLGSLNKSIPLIKNSSINGSDIDIYDFIVPELMNVTMATAGEDGDSEICLYDSHLDRIECNDEFDGHWSRIDRNLNPGRYYVEVRTYSDELLYNITISGS